MNWNWGILEVSVIIIAYLVGSIPFGLLITKAAGKGDVRKIGSGNIGATNVLRTGSKKLALLTLFLDLIKGFAIVYFAKFLNLFFPAALAVMVGHLYPVWLKFKGGKGVATYGGILFALSWPLGMQAVIAWIAFLALFHYSSLAALLTSLLVPFTIWIWHYPDILEVSLVLTVLVWVRHIGNIKRLITGTEPQVGSKKQKEKASK
jgi:glycerol-3-phosphate acyltransferase PlsY